MPNFLFLIARFSSLVSGVLKVFFSLLFCFSLFSANAATPSNKNPRDWDHQRSLFQQAQQALEQQKLDDYERLLPQLDDYPITAYLQYDALKQGLKSASSAEVEAFLSEFKDYPFSYHLRGQWLNQLAKQKNWTQYLKFYDGRSDVRYRCLQLTARLETGDLNQINDDILPIWLSGYSQPEACDQPFEHFLQTTENVNQVIWQRIEKAFKARKPSLARYLAKKLSEKDREWVDLWYRSHKNPQATIAEITALPETALQKKILLHALDRLARRDSLQALQQWQQLQSRYSFTKAQKESLDQRIALSAAYQHSTESKQLLSDLPDHLKTDNAHLWLSRINLRDEDWIGLVRSIQVMPQRLKNEAEWQYWYGRALQGASKDEQAQAVLKKLSSRNSYYGFLAADRIGVDYKITSHPAGNLSNAEKTRLIVDNPNLLRARELYFVDRLIDARREWFAGIRKLDQQQIRQAASIASEWRWHENAIKTVAKTSHRSDYDLRFPMPYQSVVMQNVRNLGLDPSVIYGVIRRESLYDPLARSKVGALGLMQLMPATAKSVAKSLGIKNTATSDILDINTNIRLGTQYFKSVLNRFDNNIPLAAAAYNAGPRNVSRWLPENQPLPADQWIESVPFRETRNYIQAVLAYATIFDKQMGRDTKLSSRLKSVEPEY